MMEKTFLMIKPDGVQRSLTGLVMQRLENKGFKLVAAKLMKVSEELAAQHYGEHKGKPFYDDLIRFITSAPVFAMVWEGENVIASTRKMMGETNPADALPGTIRGDFGIRMNRNIIHGSDSTESAEREIALFFQEQELLDYQKNNQTWIY